MAEQPLSSLVMRLAARLSERGERLVCAESCTGGWVAKACTDAAGSSAWFEAGFVTYSNTAKSALLGVAPELIARRGAVSAEVVCAMAAGALARCPAHWALAVSGVAGPDGGSAAKPVGTVWLAWAGEESAPAAAHFLFAGDRDAVRRAAVVAALDGLLRRLS